MSLSPTATTKLKEAIRQYENYDKENRISEDRKFMTKFYREEQRQKQLRKESKFQDRLWNIAFPCCASASDTAAVSVH